MGSTSFADASWAERSIFAFFMSLWIVYGLLNQLTRLRQIDFDATTLVLSQEVLKIVFSFGLFCIQDGGLFQLFRSSREHWVMLCWYLIPAGLYALTDVLTYINLRSFDPTTYYLLSEMKLVLTAMVHQVLFKRRLNMWHWVALGIITGGCVIKTVDSLENHVAGTSATNDNGNDGDNGNNGEGVDDDGGILPNPPNPTLINYLILVVQILASTIAGVYNEKLLKDKPSIPINLQNMCLYADGIVFLTLGLLLGVSDTTLAVALSPSNLRALFSQPTILGMACVMSAAGLVTSRFLKVFDSVRKSIAAALVVVALPFLSKLFFATPVTIKMILSIGCVALGMYIYSFQPPPGTQDGEDGAEDGDDELFLPALSPIPRVHRAGEQYAHLSQEMLDNTCTPDKPDAIKDGLTEEEEEDIELSSTRSS